MNTTVHISQDTKIEAKLFESTDTTTIKYRASFTLTNSYRVPDRWHYVRETVELWLDDEVVIDNMIAELNHIKEMRKNELNAVSDFSDKLESIRSVF